MRDGEVPAAPPAPIAPGVETAAIAGAVQCGCCHRTPLIGETVTLRRHRSSSRWICEACERSRRRGRRGREVRRERVRSFGGALNIRRVG